MSSSSDVPKHPRVIYSAWYDGRKNAPPVVQLVFDRWEALNPNYEVRILDKQAVEKLLEGVDLQLQAISRPGLSDIVRTKLLIATGGIWADSTALPMIPLDDWLTEATRDSGFFAFERYDSPLASWFLCAEPASPVMNAWWAEIVRVWSRPRYDKTDGKRPPNGALAVSPQELARSQELPHYWFHSLFHYMLETKPEVKDTWERRLHLSAITAHGLQELFLENPNPTDEEVVRTAYTSPVQKLNWRNPYPVERLAALIQQFPTPASVPPVPNSSSVPADVPPSPVPDGQDPAPAPGPTPAKGANPLQALSTIFKIPRK